MKESKKKRWNVRMLAVLLVIIFAVPVSGMKVQAGELLNNEQAQTVSTTVTNKEVGYNSIVQPLTTMFDCEIVLAFTGNGLEMTITTMCVDVASVIGVKDVKVQQKMWYGWKTVYSSQGAENQNEDMFCADFTYPDAINGKTYRVVCTHYADYDGYEEVVNDTGAFKFIY